MSTCIFLAICLPLTNAQAPKPKTEPPVKWSSEDDMQIRTSIREGGRKTAMPLKGKWALFTVLIVPREIKNAFQKDKIATLEVLQSIVEHGAPGDAITAAGYAIALAENPVKGHAFSNFPEKQIDERIEIRQETYRQFLAAKMRSLIRGAKNDATVPKPKKAVPK